jgi:hypothetical protein
MNFFSGPEVEGCVLPVILRGLDTSLDGMKVVRIVSVRPKGSDTQMVRPYSNPDI